MSRGVKQMKLKKQVLILLVGVLFLIIIFAFTAKNAEEKKEITNMTSKGEDIVSNPTNSLETISDSHSEPNSYQESTMNNNTKKYNQDEIKFQAPVTEYEVSIEEYTAYAETDKPFKVKYAQISGLNDENLESRINQTLKSCIIEWINEECYWLEWYQVSSIYKTPEYLSICFFIKWDYPPGENIMKEETRVGVTIDMQTGERVFLDDLVADIDSLKQKLVDYYYGTEFSPSISAKEADKIIHCASISEKEYFEELYKTDPHLYINLISVFSSKPSFYLKDNKLVITRDRYELNDVYLDF